MLCHRAQAAASPAAPTRTSRPASAQCVDRCCVGTAHSEMLAYMRCSQVGQAHLFAQLQVSSNRLAAWRDHKCTAECNCCHTTAHVAQVESLGSTCTMSCWRNLMRLSNWARSRQSCKGSSAHALSLSAFRRSGVPAYRRTGVPAYWRTGESLRVLDILNDKGGQAANPTQLDHTCHSHMPLDEVQRRAGVTWWPASAMLGWWYPTPVSVHDAIMQLATSAETIKRVLSHIHRIRSAPAGAGLLLRAHGSVIAASSY